MKLNTTLLNSWRILLATIFVLSFGQPSPVYAAPGVDYAITVSHTDPFVQADQGKTYTISVQNLGDDPSTGQTITVTVSALPTGLTATAINGTGWSCTLGTLTCTTTAIIASGGFTNPITLTVNVAVNAPTPLDVTATVASVEDTDDTNDSDTDTTNITQKPDLIVTGYQFRNETNTAPISEIYVNEAFWIRMTVQNQGGADAGNFYPGVFLDGKPNYGPDNDDYPFGQVTYFNDFKIIYGSNGCLAYDPEENLDPMGNTCNSVRGNYTIYHFPPSLPAGASTTVDVYVGYPEDEFPNEDYDAVDVRTGLPSGTYQIYLYADPSGTVAESIEDNNEYGPINLSIGYIGFTNSWAGGMSIQSDLPVVSVARPHVGAEIASYTGFSTGSLNSYIPMLFKGAFGGSYDSAFYVQNVNTSSFANITINYYDNTGTLNCTKSDSIAPLASKGYWVPTATCDTGSLPAGWVGGVIITSNQPIVAVARPHVGAQVMTYGGFSTGSLNSYIPMLFKGAFGGSYDSAFYVQNVNTSSFANITINYYDNTGTLNCTKSDSIAPLASKGYWVPTATCDTGSLPAGWVGGVIITSNQPIVTVGRPHIGSQVTTYNGFSTGSLNSYASMLFKGAFGGSYDSAFYIQNTSSTNNASVTIKYYSSTGTLNCTKSDTIAPLASKGYWVPTATCDTGSLSAGWAGGIVITSDQPIVTVGRPHVGTEITTYNGSASGLSSYFLPMLFRNAFGSYNSAAYIQNTNSTTPANVEIKFYSSEGVLNCTIIDSIPANSTKGYWLPSLSCD